MSLLTHVLRSCAASTDSYPQKIVVCTHAKFSAIELCKTLLDAGIDVTFHPVDYSKEVANTDVIESLGIAVVEDPKDLKKVIEQADAAIEDGARISKFIKQHAIKVQPTFFSVEQTSGGVRYFRDHPPTYPVINVAMSPVKLDIENKRATPEGVIRYFSESTGKLLGGKEVFVIGFGSIGEGISRLAQTLGAHVTVYDTFATKRMFARHQGYTTIEEEELDKLMPKLDVVFMATNTYQGSVFGSEQLLLMKDGAVLCNAGSGRGELALDLQKPGSYAVHDAAMDIAEEDDHLVVRLNKAGMHKTITILGKSFPINLHLGKGTSHDAIEVVMSLLLLALLTGPATRKAGLQDLSSDVQECVARNFLHKDKPQRTFLPKYIKTGGLDVLHKPYGGVFPFHNELSDTANLSVARAWFKAKTKTRGHYHRRSQESYYAEKGTAKIFVWPAHDPESVATYAMTPGDYLIVPENFYHDVKVTSEEDFECLVIATPPFAIWDQFFNTAKEVEEAIV